MEKTVRQYQSLLILLVGFSAQAAPDPVKLLKKVDELYRSSSSQAVMTMKIQTPHWSRELKMKSWSRGMKDTFVKILSPKKDKGISTLRRNKEMWNFFPKINKVVKVPPSMMMGSWMGSDFTNDDLVRQTSWTEEYSVALASEGKHYLLTLKPKKNTATVWGKIVARVRRSDLIPSEFGYFDEKGKKVRVMRLSKMRVFGGKKIPATMELIPLNKEGYKTTVTYSSLKFNVPNLARIFTLRNLKKR